MQQSSSVMIIPASTFDLPDIPKCLIDYVDRFFVKTVINERWCFIAFRTTSLNLGYGNTTKKGVAPYHCVTYKH